MTTEVPGQMGLDEEYSDWRIDEVGAMPKADGYDDDTRDGYVGDMTDMVLAQDQAVEASYLNPEDNPERAITVRQPQQHLVVGVGALAAMDEADFNRNLALLKQGQERLKILTDQLLEKGVDYGHVPGIAKPFLQKPGAEKLANFYGLAIRFEADRIIGDGVTSPHLTYHARGYAHLRDFDGPIVAEGFGEANTWEERYRYVTQRPICPNCGKVELVMRKTGPLTGKLNCPTWQNKGGCNAVFEPNDPRVPQSGKVENPDIWGLANTLIKMAKKRAGVDTVLWATGTSGYFSQDEDSPSVQQQGGDAPPPPPEEPKPVAVAGAAEVERGGKDTKPTKPQIDRLRALSKEKDLGPEKIAAVIKRVTDKEVTFRAGDDRRGMGVTLGAFITSSLTGDEMGAILTAIETGEVPPAVEAPAEMESAL